MPRAPIGTDEPARLEALARYEVLDTPADPSFDRIVALAARLFDAPIALVSLVATGRQWFKAKVGLQACETGRDVSFCAYALTAEEPLVVLDATRDPRFADNALVTGAPDIRFYAGAPLRTPSGHVLGTLCVIDSKPRPQPEPALLEHLTALAAMTVDALESHRLQVQLHRRQQSLARDLSQRLQALNRAAPLAIVTLDLAGRVTGINPAATQIFGYSEEEALGQPLPAEPGAETDAAPLMLGAVGHGIESRRRHRDGHLVDVSLAQAPLRGPDGSVTGTVVMAEDIGARKRLERERSSAAAAVATALERAESGSRAKTAFLNNMAHEFRTPLNAILGFSELIAQEALGPVGTSGYRDYAGYIRESGQRLMGLLNNVLDIAEADSDVAMAVAPVAVRALVDTAVAPLADTVRARGLQLEVLVDPALEVAGDAAKLGSVLTQLLSNAVKFTGSNGAVTVLAERSADGLRLEVRDTGIGMSEAELARVFEPFVQCDNGLSRRFEGAGLGLPLARRLVVQHGGKLWLESRSGYGTRAIVLLPMRAGLAAEPLVEAC